MKWNNLAACARWSALGLALLLPLPSGAADADDPADQAPSSQEPTPAGTPSEVSALAEEIAAWIEQLEDDRYEVREAASRKLQEHGPSALDPLAAVADGPGPEAAARAIAILEGLAEQASDTDLKIAVLERLVGLDNRSSVSRRAFEKLAVVWEEVSLPLVLELGGRLDPESVDWNGRRGYGKLIIGPEWTGGDEGLVHVSRLAFLHTVSIRRAAVTPTGVEQLASMPSLERLELYGIGLNEEQRQRLAQQFRYTPEVDIRRGAMLGVRGLNGSAVAEIHSVEPGSAAAAADLRAGDIVTKVDGVEVQSFEELTIEIAKHEPGERSVLQVRRGAELINRQVVFGGWE